MTGASSQRPPRGWRKPALVFAGALLASLVLVVLFFPWDALRDPIGRYVSGKTGRHFAINGHLSVSLGRSVHVRAEGVELANPSWAADPWLMRAQVVDAQLRLWPLLHGDLVLSSLVLEHAESGLQLLPDGRRTWDLSMPGSSKASPGRMPTIERLAVDDGRLHYLAPGQRIDVQARLSMQSDPTNTSRALALQAEGRFRDEPFHATGHAGNVLELARVPQEQQQPFPLELQVDAAGTRIHVTGTIGQMVPLARISADVQVQGRSLADLYQLTGVVLPATPNYKLRAHVDHQAPVWSATGIHAVLGKTDLTGSLALDDSGPIPRLTGVLVSEQVDFADLGPLIGLDGKQAAAKLAAEPKGRTITPARPEPASAGKVLPDTPMDLQRLRAMNADIRFTAAHVVNLDTIPIDQAKVHVLLQDGLLKLDPVELGFAGGRLAGQVHLDATSDPASAQLKLSLRNLQLSKLVSGSRLEKYLRVGAVQGDLELYMRGNSTARMLASADGSVAAVMGGAHMSKIASQAADLHLGELLGLFISGDREIDVRCAAAAFDVQDGVMHSRAMMFDSSDTALYGDGSLNLAVESLDFTIRQYPKDKSLLSLRSPIHVNGPLGKPAVHLDKVALAGKGAAALALGAISPLLALAATIESGPGKDANCGSVLQEAAGAKGGPAAMAGAAKQAANSEAQQPGGAKAMRKADRPQNPPGLLDRLKKAFGS